MRSLRWAPFLLLLGAGCATPGDATSSAPLKVGIATADLTPSEPYGMSGYYHERKSTEVRDPLHAKAIVFAQGAERVAIVECDLCGVSPELTREVRKRASARTGIPAERIIVAATHSHTGPSYEGDLRDWVKRGGSDANAYPARLIDAVTEAIVRADSSAAPMRLKAGSGRQETPVSFCRRFVMRDGKVQTWANYRNPETVREANPIDPEIAVLVVDDPASGRSRAGLVNFALHLDTLGGTKWSADFPHDLNEALRADLGPGFLAIFANGCCGDINHVDPRAEKRNPTEWIGRSLAASVKAALPGLKELAPSLRVAREVVTAPLQEASEEDLAWARAFVEKERAGAKFVFLDQVRAHKLLGLERLRKRAASLSLEVHAIRLDPGTAIVTLPGEVFVELGLAIKKASPFRTTFVVELANTNETAYIPKRDAYPLGGYEVANSVLAPGGGEMLANAAIALLRSLAEPRGARTLPGGRTLLDEKFAGLDRWHLEGHVAGVEIREPGTLRLDCTGSKQGGAGAMAFCRQDFPDNVAVDYDLVIEEKNGLLIAFLGMQGTGGEDAISGVPPRTGVFDDYVGPFATTRSYHISVCRYGDTGVHSGVSNWRRNPGLNLMATGRDPCTETGRRYHVTIVKKGPSCQLQVDGAVASGFTDPEVLPAPIPRGGKIGFRAIGLRAVFQISNLKVTALEEAP